MSSETFELLLPPLSSQAPEIPTFPSSSFSTYDVAIVDFAFGPLHINITTGTTVIWTYATNGTSQHTVTSSNQTSGGGFIFASPVLTPGQSYSYRFLLPGFYPYYCAVHPTKPLMNSAWVNVTGSPVTPPSSTTPGGGQPFPIVELGLVVAAVVLTASALFYVRVRRKTSSERVRV